ncbi:MAG TPA: site-specific integrase [Candidatus Melainabacteria bacterium]|nr:site-specific integrase [Candidatus Melainabacteria bacterium]
MNKLPRSFGMYLESFFIERMVKQRNASPNTIRSYRDTFRMLLQFAERRLRKQPSALELKDIDAPLISAFLEQLENDRMITAQSRNLRLAAIRSFFRYAAFEAPDQSAQIQRVLAIPSKKCQRKVLTYLTKEEVQALLDAPDQKECSGQRDHALLLVAVHTGLRLSELTNLKWMDLVIQQTGAHIRLTGKGRKERCIPLTKQTLAVLKSWKSYCSSTPNSPVFPNARGGVLSADGFQYILAKHLAVARQSCPSLTNKNVTPHTLRHTMAMELLQSGIDRAMIALWLGHESVETTQIYLHTSLKLKEEILSKTNMAQGKAGRYRPDDQLLAFLQSL